MANDSDATPTGNGQSMPPCTCGDFPHCVPSCDLERWVHPPKEVDTAKQYRLRLAVPGVPIVDGCVDLIVPSLAIFEWEVVTVKRDDEAVAWLREHGVDVRVTPT